MLSSSETAHRRLLYGPVWEWLETAKVGVSRGRNQQHIVRRAAGDMDDSDDIVVEENIPETLSPGSHQQHTSSPTVSPKVI